MHLRTEISLEPRSEISPEELLQALHPTAALGLYPRRPLSDPWMQKLDPMGCRRFYGAPFGVLLPGGHWRFVVLIRGLMFSSGELLIGSGSGVLASSSLAGEWSELEVKRRSVRRLFFK